MRCIRPTKFPNSQVHVACGQCMPCRITRRTEWLTKLELEYRYWKKGVFVTLTYAPEHLPESDVYEGGNLQKEQLQNFVKLFRYYCSEENVKIRYFGVGEYGDKSNRAHYHLAIFNVDGIMAQRLVKLAWTKGHVKVGTLNNNSMRYVLGYTIKKMTNEKDFTDGRQPEFTLMSRKPGLGHFSIPHFADILKKRGLVPAGFANQYTKWLLKNQGYEPVQWNGWFKIDGKNAKLDTVIMKKIGDLIEDETIKNAKYIDHHQKRVIRSFKNHLNRLHDDSYFGTLEFINSEEFEIVSKQAKKLFKNYEEKKTL